MRREVMVFVVALAFGGLMPWAASVADDSDSAIQPGFGSGDDGIITDPIGGSEPDDGEGDVRDFLDSRDDSRRGGGDSDSGITRPPPVVGPPTLDGYCYTEGECGDGYCVTGHVYQANEGDCSADETYTDDWDEIDTSCPESCDGSTPPPGDSDEGTCYRPAESCNAGDCCEGEIYADNVSEAYCYNNYSDAEWTTGHVSDSDLTACAGICYTPCMNGNDGQCDGSVSDVNDCFGSPGSDTRYTSCSEAESAGYTPWECSGDPCQDPPIPEECFDNPDDPTNPGDGTMMGEDEESEGSVLERMRNR